MKERTKFEFGDQSVEVLPTSHPRILLYHLLDQAGHTLAATLLPHDPEVNHTRRYAELLAAGCSLSEVQNQISDELWGQQIQELTILLANLRLEDKHRKRFQARRPLHELMAVEFTHSVPREHNV